jgi:hypothetical protein
MRFLCECVESGLRVAGDSCPGRCNTLMHYYGIDRSLIPYIAELPTSLKQGLYLPGKHIPIVDEGILAKEQPDFIIIFAWHYTDVIMGRLRALGRGVQVSTAATRAPSFSSRREALTPKIFRRRRASSTRNGQAYRRASPRSL